MITEFFKKYDLRGEVGRDFQVKDVYSITQAIVYYFNEKYPEIKNIAVGMDGRLHSPAIKEQVCDAILDSGLNVTFIGICPTPALYFACKTLKVDAGIMITASHNPKEDNGLKIMLKNESVWGNEIEEIKNYYLQKKFLSLPIKGNYQEHNIIEDYVNYFAEEFKHLKNLEINTIVDCGNGAAGTVLPLLIKKFNWKNVKLLFEKVDGNFPNHEPDPTVEENIQDLIQNLKQKNNFQFGVGLDGDCDRLAAVTKNGYLIPGDKLLAIFSQFLQVKNKNNFVVCDVKCSNVLSQILSQHNLKILMTPTGHAYIKNELKKNNGLIGGELSGHFCFNDRYFGYDDGIYAMLRLFELLHTSNEAHNDLKAVVSSEIPLKLTQPSHKATAGFLSLSSPVLKNMGFSATANKTLESFLESFPQTFNTNEYRIKCNNKEEIVLHAKKIFAAKKDIELIDVDGIRINMKNSWGILRTSNTQEMISLRFEGNSKNDLEKVKKDFFEVISPFFENSWLKKQLDLI